MSASSPFPVRLTQIAEGATARVFESRDHLGLPVALKVARASRDNRTLKREAEMAALLRHPALLRILTQGQGDDGLAWLIMPLLPGRTLADWTGADSELLDHLAPVADALDLLHHLGWGHADLKPENLLLATDTSRYPLLLGDLGLVSRLNARAGGGSPAYLSPRRLADAPLTWRDDLHSFAVLTFEKLAGVLPYNHDTGDALLADIRQGGLRDLSRFRPELSTELGRFFTATLLGDHGATSVMTWLDELRSHFGQTPAPRCLFGREIPEEILHGSDLQRALTSALYSVSQTSVQPGHEELIVIEELAGAAPTHLRICIEFLLSNQWLRDDVGWGRFREPPAVWRSELELLLRGGGDCAVTDLSDRLEELGLKPTDCDEVWTQVWNDNSERLDRRLQLVGVALSAERFDWLLALPGDHFFVIADRGPRETQLEVISQAAMGDIPSEVNARIRIWEVIRQIREDNLVAARTEFWAIEEHLDLESSGELSRLLTYQLLDAGRVEEGFAFLSRWREGRSAQLAGTELEIRLAAREITAYAQYGDVETARARAKTYGDAYAGRRGEWFLYMALANIATEQRDIAESLAHTKHALAGVQRDKGDQRIMIHLMLFLASGYTLWGRQEYMDSVPELIDNAFSYANDLGDSWLILECLSTKGLWEMNHGSFRSSEEYFLQTVKLAKDSGQLNRSPYYLSNLALSVFYQGDYSRIISLSDQIRDSLIEEQTLKSVLSSKEVLCLFSIAFGDLLDADVMIEEAMLAATSSSSEQAQASFLLLRAMIASYRLQNTDAQRDILASKKIHEEAGASSDVMYCRMMNYELQPVDCQDVDKIIEVIEFFTAIERRLHLPHAWRLLARHLRSTGDLEGAAQALTNGFDVAGEMGNPEEIWPLHVESSHLALAGDSRGAARTELTAAAQILRDLSLHFPEGAARDQFLSRRDRADVLQRLQALGRVE
ncbi:MAG: protein kinase [bacterium]|nr:protein kinase [bacterium]